MGQGRNMLLFMLCRFCLNIIMSIDSVKWARSTNTASAVERKAWREVTNHFWDMWSGYPLLSPEIRDLCIFSFLQGLENFVFLLLYNERKVGREAGVMKSNPILLKCVVIWKTSALKSPFSFSLLIAPGDLSPLSSEFIFNISWPSGST